MRRETWDFTQRTTATFSSKLKEMPKHERQTGIEHVSSPLGCCSFFFSSLLCSRSLEAAGNSKTVLFPGPLQAIYARLGKTRRPPAGEPESTDRGLKRLRDRSETGTLLVRLVSLSDESCCAPWFLVCSAAAERRRASQVVPPLPTEPFQNKAHRW